MAVIGSVGVWGSFEECLEKGSILYKSSTYFFALFSFVLYIYCGVPNYAGESVSALSFLPGAKIMVIRGHDLGG